MAQPRTPSNPMAFWIPIGVAVGVSFGMGMHHVSLGLALGIALGVALGAFHRIKTKNGSGHAA